MNSNVAASLTFLALLFGGALVGVFFRTVLPKHHLADDSRTIVTLSVGMVLTMSALLIGLLISSAQAAFDAQRGELAEMSAKIVLLDRGLEHYGPETKEARGLLRASVVNMLDQMWSEKRSPLLAGGEAVFDRIQRLSPKDAEQRLIQEAASGLAISIGQTRWLMYEQAESSVPKTLLVALASWLTIVFITFGLFAPRNATVIASLFFSALSISGAILLILEMHSPFSGLIQISSTPLRSALAQLGG